MKTKRIRAGRREKLLHTFASNYNVSLDDASYFVFTNEITNQAYNPKMQPIKVLLKTGKVKALNKVSNHLNIGSISNTITKYYICFPKSLD